MRFKIILFSGYDSPKDDRSNFKIKLWIMNKRVKNNLKTIPQHPYFGRS
jgi:hypothetical protein